MKRINKILLGLMMVAVLIFPVFSVVYAQVDNRYTVLAPLPGTTECTGTPTPISVDSKGVVTGGCKTDFVTYLPAIFKLAIGVAAVLAFIMLTWAGVQYMTTDAMGTKGKARDQIKNAIVGLLLVIGAWVILNTINPQLLNFNLTLPPTGAKEVSLDSLNNLQALQAVVAGADSGGGTVKPGYTLDANAVAQNTSLINDLKTASNNHITVNNNGTPCTNGGTKGCTNIVGEPANAIAGVKQLQKNCGCDIIINGGTEGGHVSHGIGQPIMDLASTNSTLNNYITTNGTVKPTDLGPIYTVSNNGVTATFLRESNPDHWHVVYK